VPTSPPRACNSNGCAALVYARSDRGRCPEHRTAWFTEDRTRRGSANERGYTHLWRKVRARKLARNPVCERCDEHGRTTGAAMVHHIQPISRGGDRLRMSNLQALCRPCHDAVHVELDRIGATA